MRKTATVVAGVAVVIGVALAARLLLGPLLVRSGITSDDPTTVITTYYAARIAGLGPAVDTALDARYRAQREQPNFVHPLVDDAFLARDLTIEGPNEIAAFGTYEHEVQYVVTYRSLWRSTIGEPPGPRFWFVYLGRDTGGRWYVLGEGTGP